MCRTLDLKILNGRCKGDWLGNFTFLNQNIGTSSIDYSICNQNFYENIKNFMVLPLNELSDHCKIITELEEQLVNTKITDDYRWNLLKSNFVWEDKLSKQFTKYLSESVNDIKEIDQRLEDGLINSSEELRQRLYKLYRKK